MPMRAAAPGLTSPCRAYVAAPATDETKIAVSDVADARRWSNPQSSTSRGTITMPPPTPKSAPKKPAISPIPRSFAGTWPTLRGVDALARLAAEPAAAALFLDVDGVLAPIVDRPEVASVPPETRSELKRLAARYALAACVTGRPRATAEAIVGVPELTYVGEH